MDSNPTKPYKIGVALSGGGARGFAHVGVLKALEEAGLKPDVISGVSSGSVVAVMYAAGIGFDDMLKAFTKAKFLDFAEIKMSKGGFFSIEKFKKHILKVIGKEYQNLEDLNIPTYLGLTDLDHGVAVDLNEGPIGETMVASCSIPIVFQPVTINGVRYVDGGVLRNLPASVLRDKCELLIGVNCSPLEHEHNFKSSFLDVGIRTYGLVTKIYQSRDIQICDLSISIDDISSYKAFNLKQIREVYLRGYSTARKILRDKGYLSSSQS